MSLSNLLDKVCARADIAQRIASLPRPIVFTNGVFDVLHRGHVSYLQAARALGGSLVVAINTDASARQLGKGPDRPLNRELDRAYVLAGLESVSLVTFFDEPTPVALLQELRPQIYVKGGDYRMEELAETALVKSWGGESLAIPFVDGYSTTALVQRIRAQQGAAELAAARSGRQAAFLDRDGVINIDKAYVHKWDEFEFVPGAVDAMRRLHGAGYELVIVTNQSGIARGMYTEAQYQVLTRQMVDYLATQGVPVAGVFHCPHHPSGQVTDYAVDCDCRKPQPGLIHQAVERLGIAVERSILIGDKPSDIAAARAAGVKQAYLVHSDNVESVTQSQDADAVYRDLAACVAGILSAQE